MRDQFFALPPHSEQLQIADYLDRKTAEIDQLIFKKQKLIELLEEERTALINQAVTKGIDPKAKMKASGIEWLGDVPAHWEVTRLKRLTKKIGSGVTPKGGAESYLESGIPLLRSQNIHFDGLRLQDVAFISQAVHDEMQGSKVKPGDVLINITGGSIGRCYYVENDLGEANVNQHVCIVRRSAKVTTKYLYNFLRSKVGQLQVMLAQTGGNRDALNFEQLGNFYIPLPELPEQEKIISFIEDQDARSAKIVGKVQREIELLTEYKTALISEVVTGKVDVRGLLDGESLGDLASASDQMVSETKGKYVK